MIHDMADNDSSRVERIILERLKSIEDKQDRHREEFLKEIIRINTERKFVAGVWGGLFGFVSAGILILIKMLFEQLYN